MQGWQAAVRPLAEAVSSQAGVPGMVIAAAHGGAAGYLVLGSDASGRRLTEETIFPVASITKLATALAVLRLAAQGALGLDDPLAVHLPEAAAARPGVTLRGLLCHSAGLPDDIAPGLAPYRLGLDWRALSWGCLATPPAAAPHTLVRYSNLGIGLLALVVERCTGQPFPAALKALVLAPLQIEGYLGVEAPRPPAVVAGSYGAHAGSELEPYNSVFWRSLALPWAGLATNAAGALALVQAFAGLPADFLPSAVRTAAISDQTGGLGGGYYAPLQWPRCAWGLGVELRGDKQPHWTPATAAPGSFGHPGASGCLVWCDLRAGVAWAILGTRGLDAWWRHWPDLGAAILGAAGESA